jgi:iron(III) transport system substrate-binding protein
MKTKITVAVAGIAAALLMAGCGSPTSGASDEPSGKVDKATAKAAKAYDEIAALDGDERQTTLVKKAQEEGTLSVYTSNTSMDDIVALFKDKYGIDVDVYLGTSESVLQRAEQEWHADYFGSDVIEGNGTALNALNKEDMFADYASPLRDSLPKAAQGDGWTASRFAVFAVAWNTDVISPADVPTSFEDLADPKYAGKLSMEISDTDWYYAIREYFTEKGMSEADVDTMLKKIAANSTVAKGHTQQAELLGAGQFGICVACYTDSVDRAADDGLPVTWKAAGDKPIEPLILRTSGTALMKTAQHPYAALLFQDFMLGPEVQDLLADDHRIGTVPRDDDPLAGFTVHAIDDAAVLDQADQLQDEYAALLRNAG